MKKKILARAIYKTVIIAIEKNSDRRALKKFILNTPIIIKGAVTIVIILLYGFGIKKTQKAPIGTVRAR